MKFWITLSTLIILILGFTLSSCNAQNSYEPDPVLLISIDGLMNEYIDRNETPNFDRLIGDGTWAEFLEPVFPTKTFPTHHSMSTGLYVENHGIIANSFYALDHGKRFSYGAPDDEEDERWWGGEPIWITAENQGLTTTTFFWPGSEACYDGVRPTRWLEYDGSIPDKARVDSVANWFDPQGDVRTNFSTLYFSDVDSQGHSHGPNSEEVDKAVEEVDETLGYMIDRLNEVGVWPDINIIIVSDHGMAELSDDKIIVLDEIIDMDDVNMIDWNPVAMMQPEEGRSEAIYEQLKEHEENYSVYYRDDMPDRYRFRDHERIPEIIMIADVPYTIVTRDRYEERGIIAGQHGYDHQAPEMHAFLLARGPDFREGERGEVVNMVDLYELMADLLGIEPSPNDGDPDATQHMRR